MTRYVAGFLRDDCGDVLFVRKRQPEWQRGLLNGIGGKIENGEAPIAAMQREFLEEVGIDLIDWRHFATLSGGDYEVHFFAADFQATLVDYPRGNDVGERFVLMPMAGIFTARCIPNLRWLLPMAFSDLSLPVASVRDGGLVEADHIDGVRA